MWQCELGDLAGRGDTPDLVPLYLYEPEIAVGPKGNTFGSTVVRREPELGNLTCYRWDCSCPSYGAAG